MSCAFCRGRRKQFSLSAMAPKDMAAVARLVERALKPGGKLLVRDYGRYPCDGRESMRRAVPAVGIVTMCDCAHRSSDPPSVVTVARSLNFSRRLFKWTVVSQPMHYAASQPSEADSDTFSGMLCSIFSNVVHSGPPATLSQPTCCV